MVCSDKTGTLTENVMEVTDIYTASHQHAMVHSATSGSKVLCGEREVTPDTHPDVIKVVEVRREGGHIHQIIVTPQVSMKYITSAYT